MKESQYYGQDDSRELQSQINRQGRQGRQGTSCKKTAVFLRIFLFSLAILAHLAVQKIDFAILLAD